MVKRYLYLVDEESGAQVGRWPIDGMGATAIMELERKILAECGEGVVLRDSKFNRDYWSSQRQRPLA